VVTDESTLFDAAGGMPFFESLIGRFYDGVATDPILARVYPAGDLDGARHRLTLFFAQYWGGPRSYDAERGHPRLRMRHMPFAIGPVERDAWLRLMGDAIDASAAPPDVAE
jgi:hemoglobin